MKKDGFTLIELMIVIVIIGMIALTIFGQFGIGGPKKAELQRSAINYVKTLYPFADDVTAVASGKDSDRNGYYSVTVAYSDDEGRKTLNLECDVDENCRAVVDR